MTMWTTKPVYMYDSLINIDTADIHVHKVGAQTAKFSLLSQTALSTVAQYYRSVWDAIINTEGAVLLMLASTSYILCNYLTSELSTQKSFLPLAATCTPTPGIFST